MDYSDFSRLPELLVGMLADDLQIRTRCGDEVASFFYGYSVHAELEEVIFPDPDLQRKAFGEAVRAVVNSPDFPATIFLGRLMRRIMKVSDSWSDQVDRESKRFNKVADKIVAKMQTAETEKEMAKYTRLLARATCSGSTCNKPLHEAFSMHHFAANFVFDQLGMELLKDIETFKMMLNHKQKRWNAISAIGRMGPEAAPLFADYLLENISPVETAAVIAGNKELIGRLAEIIRNGTKHKQAEAIITAENLGNGAAKICPALFDEVYKAMDSDDDAVRLTALCAIASLGADRPEIVELIVNKLKTNDMCQRGSTIMALKHFTAFPSIAVPVLIEELDSFEEYDSDWEYGGKHERVTHVLGKFGMNSLPALPKLIGILEKAEVGEDFPKDVVNLIASFGPAAKEALPALKELARKYNYGDEELKDDFDPLSNAIRKLENY